MKRMKIRHRCHFLRFTQALDFVVSEARKNKIRLILSLCNNWEDYGGKARYVRWGREAGLNLTSDDDFFSDPTVKRYYRSHVQVKKDKTELFILSLPVLLDLYKTTTSAGSA